MAKGRKPEPLWLDPNVALAIHDRQLSEHGGGRGIRDRSALESALARPTLKWSYEKADAASLAAAYAFGLARNHPFVDGNKRTAWVLARLFLALNGHALEFEPADAIEAMVRLAAGKLPKEALAEWFRFRIR